jgi:hypothetical protein
LTCVKFIMSLICTWAPEISPLSWYYFRICLPILHIICWFTKSVLSYLGALKTNPCLLQARNTLKHFWK